MSLVRLHIQGISYSQTQSGAYALILNEADGRRKLPIVIGPFEAQSIAIALEANIKPPRPLTHDLFKNFCDDFEIVIKQIIIHKLVDGIFFSSIIAEQKGGKEQIIDSRTSDAIALAIRFNAPIFTYKDIINTAGVYLQASEKEKNLFEVPEKKLDKTIESLLESSGPTEQIEDKSLEDLYKLLELAIAEEAYEKAAKIRDEISKRQE